MPAVRPFDRQRRLPLVLKPLAGQAVELPACQGQVLRHVRVKRSELSSP